MLYDGDTECPFALAREAVLDHLFCVPIWRRIKSGGAMRFSGLHLAEFLV